MNKIFFSVFFAVIAAELISAATYTISTTYEMRYPTGLGGGFLSGTVYYHFDSSNVKNSVVVYKHSVTGSSGAVTISELENYTVSRVFKICPGSCEGSTLDKDPERWWFTSGDTKASGSDTYTGDDGVKYVRYNRNGQKKGSIKALYLKDGSTAVDIPSDKVQVAAKIIFNDNREVVFSKTKVTSISKSHSGFSIPSGVVCEVKACRSYLDIAFVLDESGSISDYNFGVMKKFVIALVGNLTVSKNAANIAVFMFDHNARKIFGLSYTNIEGSVQNIRQSNGATQQGKGLALAYKELIDDNWRTPLYGKPTQFVIALTDGMDHDYPNLEKQANLLKSKGVFLIEVGVGISSYYANILAGYASKLNGESGYFNVANFDALLAKINDLVVPICEQSNSSSCGAKCNGYCGCGMKCYCPSCPTSNSKCESYSCSVVGDSTAGCSKKTVTCNDKLYCTTDTCNANTGCVYTPKTCKPQGSCQTSVCSEAKQGGCEVTNVDSKCPDLPYPCYEKHCSPGHSGANAATGCYYTYSCVGQFPVSYDNKGNYKSGCYAYSCNNATKKCETENVCSKMSDACVEYKCDTSKGMCVKARDKVTCEKTNGCRLESKCNGATGQCQYRWKTASDCRDDFIEEGAKNVGSGGWFDSVEDVSAYYKCGEATCDLNAPNPTATVNKKQNKYCVFTEGDQDKCGACAVQRTKQETHESCKTKASDSHNAKTSSCFIPKCVALSPTTSECDNTEQACPEKGCMIATCNQTTLGCSYEYTSEYKNLEKQVNACQKVICENGVAKIVDYSQELCVGENGVNVPVCKKYDHCDENEGCKYVDKCVRDKNCTTMTCDATTNTCVEKPVVCEETGNICTEKVCNKGTDECVTVSRNIDEACGTTDLCHYYECSVENNNCTLYDVVFPEENKTGHTPCYNYTCDGNTGLWTVVDECDDSRLCTIDVCDADGQCTHAPNFCEDMPKINMSCFFWSCSENRKNGCYKRIYDNAYFDECGNCIGPYDDEKNKTDNPDYSECKKALTWEEKAAVISAGVAGAIVVACVIGAIGVSVGGTLLTRELIKRARAAADSGAVENPMYQDNGREMSNPAFEGEEMDS